MQRASSTWMIWRGMLPTKTREPRMNDSNTSPEQAPIDVRRIAQLLPHRFPFLLIDRVTAWEPGKRLTAIKNVTYNEPFFQGHFPGRPIMPGVLIIEALAQSAAILAIETLELAGSGKLVYFMSIDEAKFRNPVEPGCLLDLHVGFVQKRAGTARHDAVVWGYARAASALGVDIVEGCEVKGFVRSPSGSVVGIETSMGRIVADKVGMAVAGHSSVLAGMAGFRLPVTSYALQAFVSEPLKPALDTVVLSLATGMYISQSDKGGLVIGGGLDRYSSYAQRGNAPVIRDVVGSVAEQFPPFRRVRLLRHWAGIVDVVPDSSPVIGETPVPGLYLNCGWGTGGFKAIPVGGWTLAHHIATGTPHPVARPFQLERFKTGALIDEAAASGIAH